MAAYLSEREAMLLVVTGHARFILFDDILRRSPSFHLVQYVLMPTLNKQE